MAKYMSRAKRLTQALGNLSKSLNSLQEIHDDYKEALDNMSESDKETEDINIIQPVVETFNNALNGIDISEIESLSEEMGSWRDNMSGTALENNSKFETVSEAADNLENAVQELEFDNISIRSDSSFDDILSEFSDRINSLENTISELESVEFPGMY